MIYPDSETSLAATYPGTGFWGEFEHDYHHVRKGILVQFERLGFPMPEAAQAFEPGWGVDVAARDLDMLDQYAQPYAASEAVRKFDAQRCIEIDPDLIVPLGVAFEVVHWTIPSGSVGVLESLPTIWADVTALDGAGLPVFSYGGLNGEDLCLSQLTHPNPAVGPLTWQHHLTYTDQPSLDVQQSGAPLAYEGPINPASIGGQSIIPPWPDARYGHAEQWGQYEQFLFPSSTVVRHWIVLFGPSSRYRVRFGARLGGFWQLGGRRGSALASILTRRV